MFELNIWAKPSKEKRRLLRTRELATQRLPAAVEHQLELLGEGRVTSGSGSLGRRLVIHHRPLWLKVALYAILGRLALLAAVWSSSQILAEQRALAYAIGIAVAYLVFQTLGGIAQFWAEVSRAHLATAVELYLTTIISRKLARLDPERAHELSSGKLKNLATSDVRQFGEFVAAVTWNLVPALTTVLVLGPIVFALAGTAGVAGLVVAFLNVPLAVLISRYLKGFQKRAQAHLDALATVAGEWLRNIRVSRFLNWQEQFEDDIAKRLRLYMKVFVKRHALMCLTFGISYAWWMVPVTVMLFTARWLDEPLAMTGVFASLWIIKDLNEYLQHLPHAINLHASAVICLQRLETLEKAPELGDHFKKSLAKLPSTDAHPVGLRLEGVSVSYGDKLILPKMDLSLRLEEKTAIIGPVGAGKSTLLKLLAGELPPSSGQILIEFSDGTRADLWEKAVYELYRRHLAYVPQEPFISSSTIAGNIALDDHEPGADHLQAAYLAELVADLEGFTHGLEEAVGETGLNLSGGQRQRLSLARAFFAKRHFLLLDDPLSAVDSRTEAALMTALVETSLGFILVSHRLAELRRCDRLIVIEQGAVVEDGAPETLLDEPDSSFARFLFAGVGMAPSKHGARPCQ